MGGICRATPGRSCLPLVGGHGAAGAGRARQLAAQPGRFKVRLWGGEAGPPLPATVREIAGSADPVTRTFLVKADIGNAPVRLGQTATVQVELPPVAGIVTNARGAAS